jgi:similar to spore coat protein
MINDYLEVENAEGMPNLADGTVALDFLLAVKTGIKNYALALSEATSPAIRTALLNQLQSAIAMHGEISELMMSKGWLHPYDTSHQLQVDLKSAEVALRIAGWELFPGNTDRLGTFATPYK